MNKYIEWISADNTDKTPVPGNKYLTFSKRWGINTCTLDYWEGPDPQDSHWSDGIYCTHWAELPEEPK